MMFEPETCKCGRQGEIVKTHIGTYVHRCRVCGVSWVTEKSPMDVANELVWATRNDDAAA